MQFDNTRLFRALSNDKRLTILSYLKEGEMCMRDLTSRINIPPTIMFQHLRVLVNCGLVGTRKIGKQAYYYIDPEGGKSALALFRRLIAGTGDQSNAADH